MRDVMLDLETWGTLPGCAIRSVGAVTFPRGFSPAQIEEFYRNVDTESCTRAGLVVEEGTRRWWAEPNKKSANDALLVDPLSLERVVEEFHSWWRRNGCTTIWCQGATFDVPIWEAACRAIGATVPWKFWDVRCTRTAYDLGSFDPRSLTRDGVHHNALDDAKFQVRCVQEAMRRRS